MKTVLQFLCQLEGKNFSGPNKGFFRSLGKRRRVISQGQTFCKFSTAVRVAVWSE